jgi:hypothetical protein
VNVSVGLEPGKPGEVPSFAYALVKLTYDIVAGRALPSEPEPLEFELYAAEPLDPPIPPGSDYWLYKAATDVVIRGSAYAPNGKPVTTMQVMANVGPLAKRIAVFGRREVRWRKDGQIYVTAPEPFSEIPLVYSNTYGGLDPRVPIPELEREAYSECAALGLTVDHPGLYPRNAVGKGYCVYPEPILGLEMPNLEDPDDLLGPSRIVTGDPRLWYRQPLPWCFEWTQRLMYPRELLLGLDAWYPCPAPQLLSEVRRGYVPASAAHPEQTRVVPPLEVYQEASLGFVARSPLTAERVTVFGMHPEQSELSFLVPAAPIIEIEVDRCRYTPRPLLSNLVIRPGDAKFTAVWCACTAELPRKFIPQVHKNIPLQVRVNGGRAVRYESPRTVRERLQAGAAAKQPNPSFQPDRAMVSKGS